MRAALLPALLLALVGGARAQPLAFGSADDPLELGSALRPDDRVRAAALAGPAYLPDDWRAAARVDLDANVGRVSVGVGQTVHSGAGGLYGPEDDEWYDLARALRYLRWNATTGSRSYARLGPTTRVSLGVGALVSRYRTTTAWDERTLGAEAAVETGGLRVAGFADGAIRLDGVVGGEVAVRTGVDLGPARDLTLTLGGVHDLGRSGLDGDSSLTGVEVTLKGSYSGLEPIVLRPFLTHARYLGRGATVGGGAEVGASNIGDAVRARARAAVFVSTAEFVPGHVGPFYAISNGEERIVDDRAFFDPAAPNVLVGTPLDSLSAGVDVVLDGRLVAFGRAEVSGYFRRHIGDERASGFGVRVAGQLPEGGRLEFGLERQDFRGVFDLIQDLGAVNALVLDLRVPVGRRALVFVRSRYGYRRLTADDGPEYAAGPDRYLVERRFEPLVGIRLGN